MKITILYETQTGTTHYVAEILQRELEKAGHQVVFHSVKYDGTSPNLVGSDVLLVGAPTYDDGLLEKNMRNLVSTFKPDLSSHKVAVFGLGNRTYPQFCRSADLLEEWVKACGGTLLLPSLRLNGFPDDRTPIYNWAEELIAELS